MAAHRAAGEEWRLITPSSEDALTKHQREMFKDIQAESGPNADRTVMITTPEEPGEGLRHLSGDLMLIKDDSKGKRYAFQWPEELPEGRDEEHRWLTKHVNGEFAIAADEPWLYSIRLFAPKPTRLRSLLMMQVDDRRVTVNSDFERVEVASD